MWYLYVIEEITLTKLGCHSMVFILKRSIVFCGQSEISNHNFMVIVCKIHSKPFVNLPGFIIFLITNFLDKYVPSIYLCYVVGTSLIPMFLEIQFLFSFFMCHFLPHKFKCAFRSPTASVGKYLGTYWGFFH